MRSPSSVAYVISNIGAFGEDVVKIGLTRRLDPLDRVRELGDAGVPFRYDVHALFSAKGAVGIEQELHRRLGDRRINRVNLHPAGSSSSTTWPRRSSTANRSR